jgi:hypothetical protein
MLAQRANDPTVQLCFWLVLAAGGKMQSPASLRREPPAAFSDHGHILYIPEIRRTLKTRACFYFQRRALRPRRQRHPARRFCDDRIPDARL